jgi:membrane protein
VPPLPVRATFSKFFNDRGTHLAAMVAYFALASFVPLTFLALAILGFTGRAGERSALVTYLKDILPADSSVENIVRVVNSIQRNARTLGIVGAVFLLWSSVSLFSALESAFNIVYGRPNRGFLRGKALAVAYMLAALLTLFAGLFIGTVGYDLLRRYAPDVIGNSVVALGLTMLLSAAAFFLFLVSAYHRLTNARLSYAEVLPGAIVATIGIEVSVQALPLFVRLSADVLTLQTLGATALLIVWLYVLANAIVWGAVFNWQLAYGETARVPEPKRE